MSSVAHHSNYAALGFRSYFRKFKHSNIFHPNNQNESTNEQTTEGELKVKIERFLL